MGGLFRRVVFSFCTLQQLRVKRPRHRSGCLLVPSSCFKASSSSNGKTERFGPTNVKAKRTVRMRARNKWKRRCWNKGSFPPVGPRSGVTRREERSGSAPRRAEDGLAGPSGPETCSTTVSCSGGTLPLVGPRLLSLDRQDFPRKKRKSGLVH